MAMKNMVQNAFSFACAAVNASKAVALLAAIGTGVACPSSAFAQSVSGDWLVEADTNLTEDVAVDGALVVPPGVTVNLNGHELAAKSLRGAEIFEDGSGVKYERLDYIESDGTQYIITDFTPAAGDRVEIQIAFTEDGGNYSGIISTRSSDGGNGFSLWRTGSNGGAADLAYAIRADYGTYNGERFLRSLGDKMKASAGIRRIVMHSGWPGNGKYAVVLKDESDATLAVVSDLDTGSYNPAGPLALMTNGKWIDGTFTPGDGFNAKLRFYWLKFDADGAKCTIYPVRRLSDGTLGAFNAVTRKFLPPATGTFTKCGEYTGFAGGTVADAFTQGTRDLTVADASRVTQVGTLYDETYSMASLFNNNYKHPRDYPTAQQNWSTQRILAKKENLPVKVDYDFGDGTPQVVDAYKMYFNQSEGFEKRAPKAWKFYGSNDPAAKGGADDALWTLLDERTSETNWQRPEERVFSFKNETPYRFYRICFSAAQDDTDGFLELVQLEYFRAGRLRITVPQGETVKNAGVAVSGDVLVVKDGAGTLNMAKASAGFGGERRLSLLVKEGYAVKTGATPCGASGSLIQVEDGAQFDLNGDSYGHYDYAIAGSGPDGAAVAGALVNNTTVENAWDSKLFMRNIYLKDDATIGGTQNIGMSYGSGTSWAYLNGHALTYRMASGVMIYNSRIGYAGPGEIVLAGGRFRPTVADYPVSGDVSIRVLSGGVYDAQDKAPTQPVREFTFAAGGTYAHTWNNYANLTTAVVLDKYAPNTVTASGSYEAAPKVQLGASGGLAPTLDLSLHSATFDGTTTTFFGGATVTVDIGGRTVQPGERLVSWTVPPPETTSFVLRGTGAYITELEMSLEAANDGLVVRAAATPAYAEWDVANERWKFLNGAGEPFPLEWTGGVTPAMSVRFASLAEYEAIASASSGLAPASYILTALPLAAGAGTIDMTGFDFAPAFGVEIDLKGNTLKLPASAMGSAVAFTVTNTAETVGTLLVDVASGETVENTAMAIGGPVKVLKTGEGTFLASKANQTYTGGTEVTEGELRCGRAGDALPYGAENGEIVVSKTGSRLGVMEMNGKVNYNAYRLVLNGGRLQNTLAAASNGSILWDNLRLEDDSFITVTQFYGFIGMWYGPTEIDLNGHTLTVNIGGGMDFLLCSTTIHDGTFHVASGGFLQTMGGTTVTATDNVTMKLNCAFRMNGPMDVANYESLYADGWNRESGKMRVYGTFTPTTDYFWGCEMQDGSTLDLSGKSGTWSTRNLTGSSMGGVRDVTFAKGTAEAPSTITVKVDPANAAIRSLARQKDPETGAYCGYIVKWTDTAAASRPDATVKFQLDPVSKGAFKLEAKDDGLVLFPAGGLMLIIR